MTAMVEITHLTKRFGSITAVDNVSFQVHKGEVLGFLGPNGAGKSTTMRMITGFLNPDAGSVMIGGNDLARDPVAAKKRIGYLPEGAPLYGDMTPAAFLDFAADIRALKGAVKQQRIADIIATVNLEPVLHQPIETLSKGFKRRLGLAQAILHDPEVLVLDEPTDGLDPNQKHEVRALIRSMATNKAIILSTHILEEVDAVCSRAMIIARGKVVADGAPAELEARSPCHNAVILELGGDQAAAWPVLQSLPNVIEVLILEQQPDRVRYRLLPMAKSSLVTAVGEAARTHGWNVTELHVERGRLDEVFRAMTTVNPAEESGS